MANVEILQTSIGHCTCTFDDYLRWSIIVQLAIWKTYKLLFSSQGLTFTCPGGIHMFTLFNNCAPSWNLIFFALIEVILVAWVYGMDNFLENINEMLGTLDPISRVNWLGALAKNGGDEEFFQFQLYWHTCWKYVTPAILIILMVFEIVNLGHIRYKDYIYPIPIQLLGQAITGISIVWIPIFAFWQRNKNSNEDGLDSKIWLLKPTQVRFKLKLDS